GYKHFLDRPAFERSAVAELSRLYRLVNQLAEYQEAVAALPALKRKLEELRAERQALHDAPQQPDKRAQESTKKALKQLVGEIDDLKVSVTSAGEKQAAVETSPILKSLSAGHPEIAARAREETAGLHAGDAQNLALWRQFMPACLAAMDAMYRRL